MPPRKEPTRLQDFALTAWADYVGLRIVRAIRNNDSGVVRRRVDLIKSEFCDCIPMTFFDEFAVRTLKMISVAADRYELTSLYLTKHRDIWPDMFVEGVTRMEPLPGICTVVKQVLWSNCSRFKKLKTFHFDPDILDDSPSVYDASHSFVEPYLRGFGSAEVLTTFVLPILATNADLNLIAENCPNLEVVDVRYSAAVDSTGIAALKRCSKLRSIDLQNCDDGCVTCEDVLELLSTLHRVENVAVTCQPREDFDCNGCLKSNSIYPAVKSYYCEKRELTSFDLLALAKKFPNLTHLEVKTTVIENISILDRFSNLSSINIWRGCFDEQDLTALLGKIGVNITELMLSGTGTLHWRYLYVIHQHCPNMEVLEFEFAQFELEDAYKVPPFSKLKRFIFGCEYSDEAPDIDPRPTLDIPDIRTLEHLECRSLEIAPEKLFAIILDVNSFPRLSSILCYSACIRHQKRVAKLIQSNNLDLVVEFYS